MGCQISFWSEDILALAAARAIVHLTMDSPNFKKELTACFGQPVAENPTAVMVEAAYGALGLDWRYLTIEVGPADLEAAVAGAKAMGFQGFNCTIPHKLAVIDHLDGLGESAEVMGAVNCVVVRDGRMVGENTDGKGFVEGLKKVRDPGGASLVVLGAGGAARAVAVEMALAGCSDITVVNRSEANGQALADLIEKKTQASARFVKWDGDYRVDEGCDIVVNATSIGLYPDLDARVPLETGSLSAGMVVADVIPNPPRTRLVRDAEARGCKVIDGLEMLVNQGVIGIEYWTGMTPDTAVMRQALEDVFSPGQSS